MNDVYGYPESFFDGMRDDVLGIWYGHASENWWEFEASEDWWQFESLVVGWQFESSEIW